MFCSSRWVAKLWRKVCGVTRLVISAIWAAAWQARVSWRVVWAGRLQSRKQPPLRAANAIPIAQKFEQHRRKHRVAILATFALLDAQHHAFGIDVGYLQRDDLRDAQSRTVSDTERSFVLDARRCLQKARNLFRA